MKPSRDISRLIDIMAALRTPESGCPWDLEQDFSSISAYTIEEAYEVADAIERQDWDDLRDELGDLLLQPIYHARMAEEAGLFDFSDVIAAITTKMIRRHPHVFGSEQERKAGMTKGAWEKIKALEREERKQCNPEADATVSNVMDDVPATLPSLQTAVKLQKRAASVGFDWSEQAPVFEKIQEEIAEVKAAISSKTPKDIELEIGDLLFTIANLARHLDVEPDNALRKANHKFKQRFGVLEKILRDDGIDIKTANINQMEDAWQRAKRQA